MEDDGGSDLQFRLNIRLSGGMTYVLVMTTYRLQETGTFSIVALGPNKVIFERLSEYKHMFVLYSKYWTKSKVCSLN